MVERPNVLVCVAEELFTLHSMIAVQKNTSVIPIEMYPFDVENTWMGTA